MPETHSRRERIWIMGASEGIGAALARAYARRGAALIVSARNPDRLAALVADIAAQGGRAQAVAADVTDAASLDAAAHQIAATGPLDAAITLAALYDPGAVLEIDAERAGQIVTANLTGSFRFARAAVPLLRPGGQLALTGSVAGYFGLPQGQIYSATKAGVISLAQSLRVELAGRADVRLINPGFVATRLTAMNDFTMPGLMTPEAAALRIVKGLAGRGFEISFPRRLLWPLKMLSALPYPLALALTRRMAR